MRRKADSGAASGLAGFHALRETFKAAVIRALDFFGKTAAWKLFHAQVIPQTFAAKPVSRTPRIAACTGLAVAGFRAFHALRLYRQPSCCQFLVERGCIAGQGVRSRPQARAYQARRR